MTRPLKPVACDGVEPSSNRNLLLSLKSEKGRQVLVRDVGLEPTISSLSDWCSAIELVLLCLGTCYAPENGKGRKVLALCHLSYDGVIPLSTGLEPATSSLEGKIGTFLAQKGEWRVVGLMVKAINAAFVRDRNHLCQMKNCVCCIKGNRTVAIRAFNPEGHPR